MLKRSLAVVLLFLGASHAANALDQRCGGAFDWLLCVNPGLSYSETSPQSAAPSQAAGSQTDADKPATQKPSAPDGSGARDHPRELYFGFIVCGEVGEQEPQDARFRRGVASSIASSS